MSKHPLSAIRDRIIVKPDKPAGVTSGGIALPDSAGGNPSKGILGTVVSKGAGGILSTGGTVAIPVDIGDKIYFSKLLSVEFEHESEKYFSMQEIGVLAVLGK